MRAIRAGVEGESAGSRRSSVRSIQSLILSDSATPWTAACQASLSVTNSQSLLKLMSIESVMPSSHLILCQMTDNIHLLSEKLRQHEI